MPPGTGEETALLQGGGQRQGGEGTGRVTPAGQVVLSVDVEQKGLQWPSG